MSRKINSINSSSLFHFTRKFDGLKNIIKRGLRYSYSFEEVPNEVIINELFKTKITVPEYYKKNDKGVVIPMICFCDIPLLRTTDHSSKYGEYVIGLDKDIMIELYNKTLNPILYRSSQNINDMISRFSELKLDEIPMIQSLCNDSEFLQQFEEKGTSVFENIDIQNKVKSCIAGKFFSDFLVGMSKPYEGTDKKGNRICYYDEREWRVLYYDDGYNCWEWGITKEEYDIKKSELNKDIANTENGYLNVEGEDDDEITNLIDNLITHIIVKRGNQINPLIDYILDSKEIFGYNNLSYRSKLLLISKITSFDRIKNDY